MPKYLHKSILFFNLLKLIFIHFLLLIQLTLNYINKQIYLLIKEIDIILNKNVHVAKKTEITKDTKKV